MKIQLAVVLFLSMMWVSCEKTLNLNIQTGEEKIAIDAKIQRVKNPQTGAETGYPPIVIITRTLDMFGSLDSLALANLFIHNAVVKVSDGSKTVTLKEYNITNTPVPGLKNAYFYTIDTSIPGNIMLGEFNKSYDLSIEYKGKIYNANTTIFPPIPIDSSWTQEAKENGIDSPYIDLRIKYTDPIQKGNYNYYKTTSKFVSGKTATVEDYFTDEVTNGVSLKFTLRSGSSRSSGQRGHFFEGDTANVEWSSVPFSAYSFFNTKQFSTRAVGNPFATPVAITGNFSNGGLGAFIGYGTINYKFIIKK